MDFGPWASCWKDFSLPFHKFFIISSINKFSALKKQKSLESTRQCKILPLITQQIIICHSMTQFHRGIKLYCAVDKQLSRLLSIKKGVFTLRLWSARVRGTSSNIIYSKKSLSTASFPLLPHIFSSIKKKFYFYPSRYGFYTFFVMRQGTRVVF